jgi:hypothetical protein
MGWRLVGYSTQVHAGMSAHLIKAKQMIAAAVNAASADDYGYFATDPYGDVAVRLIVNGDAPIVDIGFREAPRSSPVKKLDSGQTDPDQYNWFVQIDLHPD